MKLVESSSVNAPTLLFLHGAGVASWAWRLQQDAFSQCHLLIPDLPDHGESRGDPFTSVEAVAERLLILIEKHAPTGPLHVIGHSLGAKVALELIRSDATGAHRVSTAVIGSALLGRSLVGRLATSRTLNRLAIGLMRWGPIASAQSRRMGFPDESMRARFRASFEHVDFTAYMRPLDAFRRYDHLASDGVENIDAPVLITFGACEPSAIRRTALEIAQVLRRSEVIEIGDADHAYPWKNAAVFNGLIDSWITRASLPPVGGFSRLWRTGNS